MVKRSFSEGYIRKDGVNSKPTSEKLIFKPSNNTINSQDPKIVQSNEGKIKMKKLKCSPGEWKCEEFYDVDDKGYVDNKTYLIYTEEQGELFELKGTDLKTVYDVKIILAAKGMLEALIKCLIYFCDDCIRDDYETCETKKECLRFNYISKTIEKATGMKIDEVLKKWK